MQSIEALGAASGEVTGSAFVLTDNNGTKVLVDCGAFQGTKDDNGRNRSLNSHDPQQLAGIVITHAHLDHLGRLPHLAGSQAPIYMTAATLDLAIIALKDAEKLSPGLFPPESVNDVFRRVSPVEYGSLFAIGGLKCTLTNAGHILGSAAVAIREKGETIVFSGDIGNKNSRTVLPATPIKQADVVVMEATYGDGNHPEEGPVEVVQDAIERIKKNGGTLLIPAFAIDRTQALLNILKELEQRKILKGIPVYLDAPMGIEVTKVYKNYQSLLRDEIKGQENPFHFKSLKATSNYEESKKIADHTGPAVIIAGSGMMSGGRIVEHANHYLSRGNTVILFIGHPAEKTLSGEIAAGEKKVQIGNDIVSVKGKVLQTSALSAHADQRQLLTWLRNIQCGNRRLRRVVLVHGSNQSREALAHKIREEYPGINVSLPAEGETIDLQKNN